MIRQLEILTVLPPNILRRTRRRHIKQQCTFLFNVCRSLHCNSIRIDTAVSMIEKIFLFLFFSFQLEIDKVLMSFSSSSRWLLSGKKSLSFLTFRTSLQSSLELVPQYYQLFDRQAVSTTVFQLKGKYCQRNYWSFSMTITLKING